MKAAPPETPRVPVDLEVASAPPVRSQFDRNLGWIALGILVIGCLLVLQPFVSALLWAVVLSYSSWPVYEWVLTRLGGRRTLASLAMAISMLLVLMLPLVIVGSTLAGNVQRFTNGAREWVAQGPPPPPAWIGKMPLVGAKATERWRVLQADTVQFWKEAQKVIEPISAWALKAAVQIGGGLLQMALSILIALFLFRDGVVAAQRLNLMLHRIAGPSGERLLKLAGGTVRGVVYGILGTALVQAVLAGTGFLIAGVPAVGLLAFLTFFAAFVPLFGTAMIWVPAAIWLFSHSTTSWGVFMIVWGLIVGNVDNFLRPMLISRGSNMPFVLILFGVLGGALAFGFIGVFLGPTLLAVGFRLLDEWSASARLSANATIA